MYKSTLKIALISCFLLATTWLRAQENNDCKYSQVELGEEKHIAMLRTETEMVDSYTTLEKGRVVDFSLLNSRGLVVLNVEIYKDAKEQLFPKCIGEEASFTFVLENGSTIVLPQIGTRLCGYELEPSQEGFYNVKNRGSFLITEDKFADLQNFKLISATLRAEDYESYFVFKSDLYNDENQAVTYPDTYFMRSLDCVVKPTIVVQE